MFDNGGRERGTATLQPGASFCFPTLPHLFEKGTESRRFGVCEGKLWIQHIQSTHRGLGFVHLTEHQIVESEVSVHVDTVGLGSRWAKQRGRQGLDGFFVALVFEQLHPGTNQISLGSRSGGLSEGRTRRYRQQGRGQEKDESDDRDAMRQRFRRHKGTVPRPGAVFHLGVRRREHRREH